MNFVAILISDREIILIMVIYRTGWGFILPSMANEKTYNLKIIKLKRYIPKIIRDACRWQKNYFDKQT